MEILKIKITEKIENLEKIEKNISKLLEKSEYNPIWQSIKWNLMLQKTDYIEAGFFI